MTKEEFLKFKQFATSSSAEDNKFFITMATQKVDEKNIIAFLLLMKDLYGLKKSIADSQKDNIRLFYEKASPIKNMYLKGSNVAKITDDVDLSFYAKRLLQSQALQSGANLAAIKHYYSAMMNQLFAALEHKMEKDANESDEFSIKMTDEAPSLPTDDHDVL